MKLVAAMPDVDFTFNVAGMVNRGVTVAIILVATWILVRIVRRVITRLITAQIPKLRAESPEELASRSHTLSAAISQTVGTVIWIIAGMMVLSEAGINIGPLVAALGLASLALGFAAQGIIRDYIHGMYILLEDWYRVGEVAIVAGIGGLVVDITLRRTVLRDLDGVWHNIPNSKIEMASNVTRDMARINLNIEVAYGENLDNVIRVINEVGVELKADETHGPNLLTTPRVEGVDKLGSSGIEIKILGDTKAGTHWGLTRELRKRLKDRFDEEGIEIPWPHAKVYFGDELRHAESVMGDRR